MHVQVGKEGIGLENRVHVAQVSRQRRDVRAVEPDCSFIGLIQAGDQTEQRRFAASRRAENRKKFASPDREIDAGQGQSAAELADQVFQAQERRFGRRSGLWGQGIRHGTKSTNPGKPDHAVNFSETFPAARGH